MQYEQQQQQPYYDQQDMSMTYSASAASSPTSKKKSEFKRAQSAASHTKSKSKVYASARSGTITVNGGASQARGGQAPLPACLQDQRNLEEQLVELEHLRTLNIEVNRERAVTEDVQRDNEMLRKQLARANESI